MSLDVSQDLLILFVVQYQFLMMARVKNYSICKEPYQLFTKVRLFFRITSIMNVNHMIKLLNIVSFLGSCYNIPICIWLMDTHPNNAPMCYVKPTADMHIKVSMFVDHNGKIYLPYLHDWVPVSRLIINH